MATLPASLSARSFPFTLACPGQCTHWSFQRWMSTIDTFQYGFHIPLLVYSLSLVMLYMCQCHIWKHAGCQKLGNFWTLLIGKKEDWLSHFMLIWEIITTFVHSGQLALGLKQIWLSGRIIVFSWVNFPCWLPFWYPFHPQVTTVACKRSWTFCQKNRWQVRAKHKYTLCMWLCMEWHCKPWCIVAWCTHNVHQGSSSFTSHVSTK